MRILVAKFTLEANEHVPMMCDLDNTAISFGKEALSHMQLGDVFNREDIEVIPVICADAACSGVMKKEAFEYIEGSILRAICENIKTLDGIYLHLHGASEVEDLGSGEHHLLEKIREIVGPYLPIAVACDPHGNLCKEYVGNTTFIRSYREAPHTDIAQTVQRTCRTLIDLIEHPKNIKPVYRKLPMILGGEQSVSADEPVKSINKFMDELETNPKILSCSWHVGYLRHDTPVAGCGIVVIPTDQKYQKDAEEVADQLADYVWNKRHEFHYTGLTAQPDEAMNMALSCEGKPVFITDSGDNVTSGAMGANTYLLDKFLKLENLKKKVLFVAINDPDTCHMLLKKQIGNVVSLSLGMGIDELTNKIELTAKIKYFGQQEGTHMYGEKGNYGPLVTITVQDHPIDIVITDNNHSFVEKHQIDACGVSWDDYDIIVVKQGYIHPEMKEKGKLCVMALTDGATPQDTRLIPFKLIMRPMFPIDNI